MFERFTDRARRVVVVAQEEARSLNHDYIGTEHILLGLLREREGVAAQALASLGVSLDAARQQVVEIVGRGQGMPSGHIPFTRQAKKVLELSLREALQLGHNYIGTEHILLGLVRDGDGVAAQVLVRLGVNLNQVRQEVIQLLRDTPEEEQAGVVELPGEGSHVVEQETASVRRTVRAGPARHLGPPVSVVGSRIQLENLNLRIGEITSRLDVITERLAVIERLLVEGTPPAARARRKPPAATKPKPPPDERAGSDEAPQG